MERDPQSFLPYIRRIHDEMEKSANRLLEKHGVTFAQAHMLIALSQAEEQGGEATALKELERHFGSAQSTVAGIVVRLERKGLIRSFADPGDKRVKRVRLTDAGRAHCRESREEMDATQRRILSALTPEEAAEIVRLLKKVYDAIKTNPTERRL